jgi:hypothetical protein
VCVGPRHVGIAGDESLQVLVVLEPNEADADVEVAAHTDTVPGDVRVVGDGDEAAEEGLCAVDVDGEEWSAPS